MSISAEDVKKLRDMTGAGMMDAKKALKESDLDFDKAVIYLREKGLADSKKRSGKDANEGTIGDYIHYQQDRAVAGVLVELACETDFVAKSEEFKDAAKQIAMHIAAMKPTYLNIDEVPESKVNEEKDIIKKHDILEKELASGNIDPKLFAKKSKEYSNLGSIISIAKEYVNFENEKKDLELILDDKSNDREINFIYELF